MLSYGNDSDLSQFQAAPLLGSHGFTPTYIKVTWPQSGILMANIK